VNRSREIGFVGLPPSTSSFVWSNFCSFPLPEGCLVKCSLVFLPCLCNFTPTSFVSTSSGKVAPAPHPFCLSVLALGGPLFGSPGVGFLVAVPSCFIPMIRQVHSAGDPPEAHPPRHCRFGFAASAIANCRFPTWIVFDAPTPPSVAHFPALLTEPPFLFFLLVRGHHTVP